MPRSSAPHRLLRSVTPLCSPPLGNVGILLVLVGSQNQLFQIYERDTRKAVVLILKRFSSLPRLNFNLAPLEVCPIYVHLRYNHYSMFILNFCGRPRGVVPQP